MLCFELEDFTTGLCTVHNGHVVVHDDELVVVFAAHFVEVSSHFVNSFLAVDAKVAFDVEAALQQASKNFDVH